MKNLKFLFVGIILTATTAIAQIPTNGLVSWYPFTGNANDAIGTNNGTASGASLTTDRFGNANSAYSFNGSNNHITMPSGSTTTLNITGNLTLAYWFKTTQGSGGCMISLGDNINANSGGYLTSLNGGNVGAGIHGFATVGKWHASSSALNDGKWHNAVVSLSTDTLRIYIDNVLDSTILNVAVPKTWSGTRALGSFNDASGGFFNGSLDDIRIYNRALSASEINSVYTEALCYKTSTVTDTLVINAVLTGFNPVTYANEIKIYPNPTDSKITIDNGSNYSGLTNYTLKITNTLGQVVFTNVINQKQFVVDLSTWTGKGIYFVNVINNGGATIDTRKIVLQ